jgi:hypothetical protein
MVVVIKKALLRSEEMVKTNDNSSINGRNIVSL